MRDWLDLQNGPGGVVFVGAGTGRSVDLTFLFGKSNLSFLTFYLALLSNLNLA